MYPCDIYCVAFKPPSYRWIPPPYYVYAISFTHGCRAQKAMAERHAHTCKFARTHVPGVLLNWHYSLLRYVHTLSPGTVRHVNAPGLLHMSWTWKPITYHMPYHPYHPYPHPDIRILPHTHRRRIACIAVCVSESNVSVSTLKADLKSLTHWASATRVRVRGVKAVGLIMFGATFRLEREGQRAKGPQGCIRGCIYVKRLQSLTTKIIYLLLIERSTDLSTSKKK